MDAKTLGHSRAFPSVYQPDGLTKRELFAAMCMQSLAPLSVLMDFYPEQAAKRAVAAADALLAELAKAPTNDQ